MSGPKLIGYCCHDVNITSILKVLGVNERHSPSNASSIFFELRQKNGTHYINIIYRQKENVLVNVLGHNFDIKFEDFKNTLSGYVMTKDEFYKEEPL